MSAVTFVGAKKPVAAAATGEFSRTGVPDKLISGLFIAAVVLCAVIVTAKSIVTGNREILAAMVGVVAAMVFHEFLDKLKKNQKLSRKPYNQLR